MEAVCGNYYWTNTFSAARRKWKPCAGIGICNQQWIKTMATQPCSMTSRLASRPSASSNTPFLRVARGEDLERTQTSPISVAEKARVSGDQTTHLEDIAIGQWFQVDAREGGTLRIQLAMMQEDEQRLLFCNQAGAKVQSLDYTSFAKLLEDKKATRLLSDASFSRALAAVVNIDTQEALAQLKGVTIPGKSAKQVPPSPSRIWRQNYRA